MVGNAFSRRPTGRQSAVIAVVLVVIGALTASVALQANPPVPPSPSPSSASSGAPSEPPAAQWGELDLPPLVVPARLEPSARDEAGIPADATFTLASLTDEPASELASRLEISPETAFTVVPSEDSATATITPAATLATGGTYRFALRAPDGVIATSWAYRVRGPVNVVSTIPGDATVGVPLATGIEITFDQGGVADMADHFSIEPAVAGTFERHGRTQVFVPASLEPATTYTVTIRAGLARTGTDLALPANVVFRFETESPVDPQPWLVFGREVLETGPTDQLDIAIHAIRPWVEDGQLPAPTSADIRVYRLPSLDAANDALAEFLAAPRWTEFSEPLMRTDGLEVVADVTAPLESLQNNVLLLRLATPFDGGWYIIEIDGTRRAQAFLQITPVSAWVSVMDDRTVVWVNDVVTHRALVGATVAVGSGRAFATSDGDGLAVGTTPKALLPAAAGGEVGAGAPILRVTSSDGAVVLVPFDVGTGGGDSYRGEWWETFGSADEAYWAMLYTDRGLYRRTDRIETWGYLRGRDDGVVPATVEVRLVSSGDGSRADAPALVSVDVRPGVDGAFLASLPISGLPIDDYQVQAVVDGRVILTRWVQVTVIRKPPYQLDVVANHMAVITGTPVTVTATATFFDGTPVVSLPVEIGRELDEGGRVETDTAGSVSVTVQTQATSTSWRTWQGTYVRPVGPEGAEIWAGVTTIVFPSAYQIDADGVLTGPEVRVTGRLTEVDLARVERELKTGWDGDASGLPVVGREIEITITELVPIRRQTGQEYDFLEKVVRPIYEYDQERTVVSTVSVETKAGGAYSVAIPVPSADHQYEIQLLASDEARRVQLSTIWAHPATTNDEDTGVQFLLDDGESDDDESAGDETPSDEAYAIGEMVAWRMVDDGATLPTGGANRYLYLIAQRGLRAAVVTGTPRFRHRFGAKDAPGVFVIGVRFTGTTYAPKAGDWATFDTTDREIRVEVTADQARYRPGETATLSIRATSPDGSPVSGTIVLQAVDEKLYAIGGASVPDPLDDLYDQVDSGIVRLTATHQLPTMSGPEGEGGDTTGGGDDRADFRDSLLFRELRTDKYGLASTTVTLSDDLTSWHVVASAVTADRRAGVGELLLPVGLPFFVELTLADTYQVSDRPVVQVRAFGDALRAGDRVEFTVASPSLGLVEARLSGTAFQPVSVELPALSVGNRSITASAVAPARLDASGKALRDGLTRTFEVVTARLSSVRTAYGTADELPGIPEGAEQTLWSFADAGRGRLIPLLSALADSPGSRLDRAVAQQIAIELLVIEFGREPRSLPAVGFDPSRYRIGEEQDADGNVVRLGVALVPDGGVDPWLAARVAVTAPDALQREALRDTLARVVALPTTNRDLQIAALAGLAALGEPVLGDLQEANRQRDLSPTELLYLALGFEATGDDATALAIERDLLIRHGEGLGPWVRLRFETTDDHADASALLAIVAAGIGDPLATGLADYAWSNPAPDTVNALELAAYARREIERTPAAPASFAYSVDTQPSTVRLEPGETFTLRLTAEQARTLSVETLSGRVGVAVEARVPVEASSLRPHVDLRLARADLTQPIAADRIVEVNLTATFADTAPGGCYDVAEQVPSGLAPIAGFWGRSDDDADITWPSSVVGQEVRFCAWNDPEVGRAARLRYLARVVNEGTFTWEPAVMQLPGAPELLAITPAGTASIGAR